MHALVVPIRDERRRPCSRRPHRGLRRRRSASTASTTAGSGSTTSGSRASALLDRYADVADDGTYIEPDREPDQRFFTMLGTLVQGRVCVGGAGDQRRQGRARRSRSGYALTRAASSGRPGERGGAAARLPHAPAPAAARCSRRPTRCTSPRSGSSHELHEVFTGRRARRRRAPARARVARRRHQGGRHLARDRARSRSAARPAAAPATCAANRFAALQGRHRRLHHLRGRQHGPAAARRQGPAHRLPRRVRRPRPARHGAVRRRPGGRDRRRAHRASASCSTGSPTTLLPGRDDDADLLDRDDQLDAVALARGAHARRRRPAAEARHRRRRATRSRCSSTARTTSSTAARAHVDRLVLEAFVDAVDALRGRATASRARPALRPVRAAPRSRPTAAGSWSTAGSPPARSKAVIKAVNALCAELRAARAGCSSTRSACRRPALGDARRRGRPPRARRPRVTRTRAARAPSASGRCSTTARALFAERGYADVTMDEVAAAVGVTKPLLYTYFGNKEPLFLACMQPGRRRAAARPSSRPSRRPPTPPAALRARHPRLLRASSTPTASAWRVLLRRDAARRAARSPAACSSTASASRRSSPPRCSPDPGRPRQPPRPCRGRRAVGRAPRRRRGARPLVAAHRRDRRRRGGRTADRHRRARTARARRPPATENATR